MKLRCLIVDDEPPALKLLQSHIQNVNGLEIVSQCKNAIEAMDVLHQKQIDLIFLDIKMPKLLGTDFLRSLSHPPKVIFTTAYREYAADSYDLDAVDYLLKPISFERFIKAVSKVKKIMGYESSMKTEEPDANRQAFVYLKVDKSQEKIYINDILYIESWKDYVKLYLNNKNNILVKQSISSMENLLSSYSFLRVHRSYIVSIKKVTGYNSLFIQVSGKKIPIGRLYKQTVMKSIQYFN